MDEQAFQDLYADEHAHCWGCGRNNEFGLQLKSYWHGDETVCRHRPDPRYSGGVPGNLYGGMICALLDCHGAATAAAAMARDRGGPMARFVTASLKVDFLKPTPLGIELEIRGRAVEIGTRKVVVDLRLIAGDAVCAAGTAVMVSMPPAG